MAPVFSKTLDAGTVEPEAHQMLLVHRYLIRLIAAGMELKKIEKKSHDILKAIAAGQSCEQILATDGNLTYHDIFHALTEAPTSHWVKTSAKTTGSGLRRDTTSGRTIAKRRRD